MNEVQTPSSIVDRLRTNLRSAGIPVSDEDVEGMIEKGLLRNAVAFGEIEARMAVDLLPDYLGTWASESAASAHVPTPDTPHPTPAKSYPSLLETAARV